MKKSLFLFFLFFLSLTFAAPPLRHLYVLWEEKETATSLTIVAHAPENVEEVSLFYSTKSGGNNPKNYNYHLISKGRKLPFPGITRKIFTFTLSHLDPDTMYFFILGNSDDGFSDEKKCRTLPLKAKGLRLVEGGDFEVTERARAVAKIAASYSPHAILLGGDYPREVLFSSDFKKWDEWLDLYTSTMISPDGALLPMILAIGNHEVLASFDENRNEAPFFFEYFPQNKKHKTYFLKKLGEEIVLFILDSGHIETINGPQLKWLENNLKLFQKWPLRFALYHVPIFPSLHFFEKNWAYHLFYRLFLWKKDYHRAEKIFSPTIEAERFYWLALFDQYKLTTAFEHHEHALKRTKLLRENKEDPHGTLYLGDGGFGPKIQWTPLQSFFYSFYAKTIGYLAFFWLIDIEEHSIYYRAITEKNLIVDEFVQDY